MDAIKPFGGIVGERCKPFLRFVPEIAGDVASDD
jgi:hypothetical protein